MKKIIKKKEVKVTVLSVLQEIRDLLKPQEVLQEVPIEQPETGLIMNKDLQKIIEELIISLRYGIDHEIRTLGGVDEQVWRNQLTTAFSLYGKQVGEKSFAAGQEDMKEKAIEIAEGYRVKKAPLYEQNVYWQ